MVGIRVCGIDDIENIEVIPNINIDIINLKIDIKHH